MGWARKRRDGEKKGRVVTEIFLGPGLNAGKEVLHSHKRMTGNVISASHHCACANDYRAPAC